MTYESDPPPLLSVVIPTYKKPDLLRLSLESLAAQWFPAGQFEVVVAEDARDDASQIVGSFASRLRVPTTASRSGDSARRPGRCQRPQR